MTPARVIASVLLGGAATIIIALALSGGDPYTLHLQLANAEGLRSGVEVRMAGVRAGEVRDVRLGRDDMVEAELALDDGVGPVGRDARVSVAAVNLLGQKSLTLHAGDARRPAPSGYRIPSAQISVSTDLQQVLDVLDDGTRARLRVLINEAGIALTGRGVDLNALLKDMPATLVDGTRMLDAVVSDNTSLTRLVASGDALVGRLTHERRALGAVVDRAGHAARTVSARRDALRATIAAAPGTLRGLRAFLADLRLTTAPLGPAARHLSATARPLGAVISELEPLRKDAEPALAEALRLAPALTRLADGATPVLRASRPTLASLSAFARRLPPASAALADSSDNLLASIENWSHAIQDRDGASHFFRGEASITPDLLRSALRLSAPARARSHRRRPAPQAPAQPAPSSGQPPTAQAKRKPLQALTDKLTNTVGELPEQLQQTVDDLLDGVLGNGAAPAPPRSGDGLLDFLLRP